MGNNNSTNTNDINELLNRIFPGSLATVIVVALAIAGLSRVGCSNIVTPAGHEGYIKTKPLLGVAEFDGIQIGPTSTGWVWRRDVLNADVRPKTYSESMEILTASGLQLRFRAHARIQLRTGSIKDVVERFGGAHWYESNVQQQFRSVVRSKVQPLKPFEVKDQMEQLGSDMLGELQKRYEKTPIDFLSLDIGNIEYPDIVVESVVRKFVTKEDNERKDVELKIAQREIDIGIAEAQGVSDSQKIVSTTLDSMFLQYEALKAIEKLADSKNTTFLIMPFSKNGTAPLIMNMDK